MNLAVRFYYQGPIDLYILANRLFLFVSFTIAQ